jgi:hypothetical protein
MTVGVPVAKQFQRADPLSPADTVGAPPSPSDANPSVADAGSNVFEASSSR